MAGRFKQLARSKMVNRLKGRLGSRDAPGKQPPPPKLRKRKGK